MNEVQRIMGYHGCPIEPDDIRYGPADEPEMLELCPKCHEPAEAQADGTWACTNCDCDWKGAEPVFEEPSDPEPDFSDFA